jgi:hypothetical protein
MTQNTRAGLVIGALVIVLGGLYLTKDWWAPVPAGAPAPVIATTTASGTAITPPVTVTAENGELTLFMGQTGVASALTLVPHELLEDSRCPEGVQCVWAGRVRLAVALAGTWGATDHVFTMGQSITSGGGETVTFVEVTPAKVASSSVPVADYRFTFKVSQP